MKNNLFILFIILFCGFFSFSQNLNITIDGNGIVSCPSGLTALGDFNDIGGKRIYVVDETLLREVTSTGSFTTGGTNYIPADLSCVCTTRVTNLNDLFVSTPTFNDDISNWDTSNVTTMEQTFFGTVSFTININSWDVSSVTDMDGMFRGATSFNQPLDNWNVGNVTTMSNMFREASAFNQPLNSWDVSKVKYMQFLFKSTIYNQPLNNWDVSSVLNMQEMFMGSDFNQPINNWEVGSVTNMYRLFRHSDFNQPLNNWDMSKVVNLGQMFYRNTGNFNQPLDNWVLSSANSISFIFENCSSFDQPLNNWDTSTITDMRGAFKSTHSFNQPLDNWDVSNVTRMDDMFHDARAFNENIDNWDVSSVTRMHEMFKDARVFNRNISGWTTTSLTDISGMFYNAISFTQNLNGWNVSGVTNMNNTFRNANAFNQPLNNWNTSNVSLLSGTFRANDVFNQDLSSWDTSSVTQMQNTFMDNTVFNNGQSSGVSNTLQWDTSTVTRMDNMFEEATAFNGNISGWNVSNVTQMDRMFFNARVFNQDLSNWNTSSATTLQGMFNGATIFNNGLSAGVSSMIMNWSTSSVTTIESTFASAPAFNGNISGWDVSNVTAANNLFNAASNFNHPLGGWDVTSINNMNNMFAAASSFDQDLNCWCVVHNPSRDFFSNSSPINSKPLFLPRWAEPCDPSISFSTSVISQDDSPISPTIISSGGTFTASITGGIVHRVNQWGSGRADFLDINATTGEINPTTSLSGVYDITYSTGTCKSFTTSITIRSVNNPLNQLSYTSSSVCKSTGGTLTPTIIPTNSHATVPRIYIDPGNPISYPNLGNAPNGETIVNLTTDSGFTHWEDGVVADVSGNHPNYMIISDNNGVVHKPGYSWELLNGATDNNFITDQGDGSYFPRESSSISMWVKESSWSSTTFLFDYTSGNDTSGKMWLSTINPSGDLRWRIKTGAAQKITSTATDIATDAARAYGVFAADMDGDGDMDILSASNADNTIAWYENNGDANPTWTASDIVTNAGFARDVHAADMDGDGDMDIVSADFGDNTIAWYENNGDANPTWTAADISTSANAPHSVFVADIDGDGDMDIVSADSGDNTIAWYESAITYGQEDNVNSMTNNNWHHLVMTRDESGNPAGGGIVKLYIDGVLTSVDYGTPTGALATPGDVIFGRNQTNQGGVNGLGKFTGEFGPIRIFAHELTQSEIEYEYDMFALRYKPDSYAATPAGLSINATTGIIDVSNSSGGIYRVTASWTEPSSGKVHTATQSITIKDPDASFSYSSNSFCQGDVGFVDPTITDAGGSFTASPSGLTIDSTSGRIIPDTSTPGNYIIEYSLVDCSATSSLSMEIRPQDVPTISYTSSGSCKNVDPSISLTPTLSIPGGSFTSSPPGLNINSATGVIIPNLSQTGTYTIDYTTNGVCPGEAGVLFVIYPILNSNFNYAENSYSKSYIGIVTPTINTIGGTFSSSPAGLDINSSNGEINPSLSNIGTYNVVYNNGLCSSTSATLTVNKIVPTIFSEIVTKTYGDPDFSISAISSSTGTFSFQVIDTNVASNTGTNSITITGVGTTTIKINQTTDANFSTASKTITLYVRKADPNIIISNIITRTYGDPNFNLTATSSSTGIFSFNALDSAIASISSNTVSIAGAGTTTIIVSQMSDLFYNAASSSLTLIVYKADPIINFPDVTKIFGDPDFPISATSSSTGDFAYSIDDLRIASQVSPIGNTTTITNSITTRGSNNGTSTRRTSLFISIEKAGSTSITAVQAEDINYKSGSASMTLTILKKDLDSSVWYPTSIISRTFGIPPFEIVLPNVDSNYNGVFNFRSSDPSIASVSSRTVTINSVGTVTLFADLSSDENYNAKTVTVILVVKKANQSIIVEPFDLVKPLKDFSSFTVSATSTSGAPVIISLAPGSAASLSGSVGNYSLTNINQTGLVTITFITDASAHPNYNSATLTMVIDVVKTNQNIIISPEPPEFLYYEENLTYKINAFSDSFLNLDYRIISGTNAILNGDTLEISDIGELKVELSQSGNNSFNPAVSKSFTIKVLQGMTILSNFNIPDKLIIDDDFVITPPSSNRSGPIKYISSNPNIAEIVGDQIIIKGIGSCTISAIQLAIPQFKSASISTIFNVNDTDCDSDGIGDTIDQDDDNDGVSDIQEIINGTDPCVFDTDNDLLGDGDENEIGSDPNNRDTDSDGIIDGLDDFPLDPNESVDTDGDGIGDNSDDDVNGDGFLDNEIFVSGLVTPGVRGNEATWKILNIDNYPGSKVSIYDRNGLLVYKKINYQNNWAGTFQQTGDLLPAGSYYYTIEISENDKFIQGWLYLTY